MGCHASLRQGVPNGDLEDVLEARRKHGEEASCVSMSELNATAGVWGALEPETLLHRFVTMTSSSYFEAAQMAQLEDLTIGLPCVERSGSIISDKAGQTPAPTTSGML